GALRGRLEGAGRHAGSRRRQVRATRRGDGGSPPRAAGDDEPRQRAHLAALGAGLPASEAAGPAARGVRRRVPGRAEPGAGGGGALPRDAHADERLPARGGQARAPFQCRRPDFRPQPSFGRRRALALGRSAHAGAQAGARAGGREGARPLRNRERDGDVVRGTRPHLICGAVFSNSPGSGIDARYGDSSRERLDLFPAADPRAPTPAFIHGGYLQMNDKEDHAFLAEGTMSSGINLAVIEYTLAPAARLDRIVAEVRRAVRWLAGHLGDYGADPSRLYVSGHSAGGHLTATTIVLPAVRGGIAISGIYDLEPIRLNYLNEKLGLD